MGMIENKNLPEKETSEILLTKLDNSIADIQERGCIVKNEQGEWVTNPSLLAIPEIVKEFGMVDDINSSSEASSLSQSVSFQDLPQSPGLLSSPYISEEGRTENADEGQEIEKCTPDQEEEPLS